MRRLINADSVTLIYESTLFTEARATAHTFNVFSKVGCMSQYKDESKKKQYLHKSAISLNHDHLSFRSLSPEVRIRILIVYDGFEHSSLSVSDGTIFVASITINVPNQHCSCIYAPKKAVRSVNLRV